MIFPFNLLKNIILLKRGKKSFFFLIKKRSEGKPSDLLDYQIRSFTNSILT